MFVIDTEGDPSLADAREEVVYAMSQNEKSRSKGKRGKAAKGKTRKRFVQQTFERELLEQEIFEDYLEHTSDLELDYPFTSPVGALSYLDFQYDESDENQAESGYYDSLIQDQDSEVVPSDDVDTDSDGWKDEDSSDVHDVEIALQNSHIDTMSDEERELMMEFENEESSESEFAGLDDSESSSNFSTSRADFKGGKSQWNEFLEYHANEIASEKKFRTRLNGDYITDIEPDWKFAKGPTKSTQSKSSKKRHMKAVKQTRKATLREQAFDRREAGVRLDSILQDNRKTVGPDLIAHLDRINVELKKFAGDLAMGDVHIIASMPAAVRTLVVSLCKSYGTKPKQRGNGKKKNIVVFRTGNTRVPNNWKVLVQNLAGVNDGFLKSNTESVSHYTQSSKGKKGSQSKPAQKGTKVGDVVGDKAKEIGLDNVGHKMMRLMGWVPGQSLGDGSGIVDPIKVTIRSKTAGLGQS